MTADDRSTRWLRVHAIADEATERRGETNKDLVLSDIANAMDDLPDDEIGLFAEWFLGDWAHALELGIAPDAAELEIRRLRAQIRKDEEENRRCRRNQELKTQFIDLDAWDPGFSKRSGEIYEAYRQAEGRTRLITPATPNDFVEFANLDHSDNYLEIDLFGGLPCRRGTLSGFGGRIGRGKTIVVVTIANEALHKGHKVVIVTFEDTPVQLIERIVLNRYRGYFIDESIPFSDFNAMEWPSWTFGRQQYPIPRYCVYAVARGEAPDTRQGKLLGQAYRETTEAIEAGQLIILDGRGYALERILETIEGYAEDVVLLDYIQKLPAPAELVSQTRQVQVQQVSMQLVSLAARTETIFLAAAQFNRINTKNSGGKAHSYDIFTDESFREAGDIEQDAYNAVGIGQEENKRTSERYYRVLKAREHSPGDGHFKLMFEGAYSLLRPTGEKWHEPKAETPKKSSKDKRGDDVRL